MRSFTVSIVAAVIALACLGGPARAEPSDKSRADAEALAAQRLYEQDKFHDAATHFVAAYELDHQPAYLFNIAQAYRFAKECAAAAKYFRLFLDATKQVQAENLDKVHRYLDEMDACARAEAPVVQPAPAAQPLPTVPVASAPPDRGRTKRIAGLALGAAGVVGLGVGVFYTHRVSSIGSDEQSWVAANCTVATPCTSEALAAEQKASQNKADSAEQRETIAYAVGGAALAGGVVLYLLGRSTDEHAVAAVPTRGGAMVTAGFKF